jgi:hypothetical protein
MNTRTPEISAGTDPNQLLPETVRLTTAAIRAWRKAGYQVSEERVAPWVYLRAGNGRDSALYKVIGPSFEGLSTSYLGIRVA